KAAEERADGPPITALIISTASPPRSSSRLARAPCQRFLSALRRLGSPEPAGACRDPAAPDQPRRPPNARLSSGGTGHLVFLKQPITKPCFRQSRLDHNLSVAIIPLALD